MRSGGRVVEGARLESEYTPKAYRGFESLPLRHISRVQADRRRLRLVDKPEMASQVQPMITPIASQTHSGHALRGAAKAVSYYYYGSIRPGPM
jgi:hypothetical protein